MKLLMVEPRYFDVVYAINPFMKTESGTLKKVDRGLALKQWRNLKESFENVGLEVECIEPVQDLPDMVFCCNHAITHGKKALLSRMRHPERQEEPELFRAWYEQNGFEVVASDVLGGESLEGSGDIVFSLDRQSLFAGYGFRSTKGAIPILAEHFPGLEIHPLELIDPRFYHLDTCFTVLGEKTVGVIPQAFTESGFQMIRDLFEDVIVIDENEAVECMAGNAFSPDGRHVFLHPGSGKFTTELCARGFEIVEVNTREFIKAGGSVFCMKAIVET